MPGGFQDLEWDLADVKDHPWGTSRETRARAGLARHGADGAAGLAIGVEEEVLHEQRLEPALVGGVAQAAGVGEIERGGERLLLLEVDEFLRPVHVRLVVHQPLGFVGDLGGLVGPAGVDGPLDQGQERYVFQQLVDHVVDPVVAELLPHRVELLEDPLQHCAFAGVAGDEVVDPDLVLLPVSVDAGPSAVRAGSGSRGCPS